MFRYNIFFITDLINMKFRFFFLLLPLLSTGCAILSPTELQINSSWSAQQAKLQQLEDWSLTGKLAIISPDERNSVNIYWQQSKQDFHISLTSFLGQTVLDIQKKGHNTVITDADGNSYFSTDTEQLIAELSGIVIPINHLQQWIKGNPSEASYQLDDNLQVSSLLGGDENSGIWSINYSDYRTINGINLPHKLQLKRADLRLKFAISNWDTPSKS